MSCVLIVTNESARCWEKNFKLYNNIILSVFNQFNSISSQFKLNTLCDLLRQEIAQAGFTEVLTFALVWKFYPVPFFINPPLKDS